ncbi:GNAT family N-acetyltransferase [Aquincola tertiaricarbonis]|uniref:GNAT family N-acetyltransferase n=1 Tax=Aquincola tertiaricarbonis TaxID=391953 RepID=A0ABY4SA87_AQUTE|nr:GNAT family N-acetyltransferase [Aquincola tertiaricarbonis]URI08987.1 GNAT family N-acetyltransferase [Aquincola tertiaricarbonis]
MKAHPLPNSDPVIRVHEDPAALDAEAWNALLAAQPSPTPFLRHEYLLALHRSGSAVGATGWSPAFLTVEQDGQLRGACPLYLKSHSYGEYVFDWAWADAYERHGLAYYPKLLGAVPFTPVPGTRLLATDEATRTLLVQAIGAFARQAQLSSAHLLFIDEADRAAFERAGWLMREGVQFHWSAPAGQPWGSFEDFLASLQREKRKKIQQERRKVQEAGVSFSVHQGSEIDDDLWDFFHRCYTLTYQAHHSKPYLKRAFFAEMARHLPQHWLMFVAWRGEGAQRERIGASLIALDPQRRVAYGRYWGSTAYVPCLHFEACYYQPLAWCIAQGYQRFEGGAQGEHKMARGLLPVKTASAHWLADPRFASAVADFLAQEGAGIGAYVDELKERNPFRPAPGTA